VAGDGAQIVEGAIAAGVPRAQTRFFASSDEAAGFLRDFVELGDLLLVKGSRGVKMESAVEAVVERYGAASGPVSGAPVDEKVRH